MAFDMRIPIRVDRGTLEETSDALDSTVDEYEHSDTTERQIELAADEEDAMVQIKNGRLEAQCGKVVHYLHRK